ncbi:MAG: hypothetical protein MR842_09495 [Clostridiales bacterium]|nr:hypothetical protein [Clostridiales bacterium]MDO4349884.1 hypothetical protein [Eubacteriales bacterium]MDY4007654.1 hypothetical protein [Candidatus Limiplasma sp.]
MIQTLARALSITVRTIVFLMALTAANFLFLCLNIFTVPFFIASAALCKMARKQCPRIALYSLMLYPTWKAGQRPSFLTDVGNAVKKHTARRKENGPIRAWEERFF